MGEIDEKEDAFYIWTHKKFEIGYNHDQVSIKLCYSMSLVLKSVEFLIIMKMCWIDFLICGPDFEFMLN